MTAQFTQNFSYDVRKIDKTVMYLTSGAQQWVRQTQWPLDHCLLYDARKASRWNLSGPNFHNFPGGNAPQTHPMLNTPAYYLKIFSALCTDNQLLCNLYIDPPLCFAWPKLNRFHIPPLYLDGGTLDVLAKFCLQLKHVHIMPPWMATTAILVGSAVCSSAHSLAVGF